MYDHNNVPTAHIIIICIILLYIKYNMCCSEWTIAVVYASTIQKSVP